MKVLQNSTDIPKLDIDSICQTFILMNEDRSSAGVAFSDYGGKITSTTFPPQLKSKWMENFKYDVEEFVAFLRLI